MMIRFLQERSRATTIDALGIPDMAAEPGFNRFTELAAAAFVAPIALLNIIRGDQQLIKAGIGMDVQCMARKDSFCQHVVDLPDLLEICDTTMDARFSELPLVTGDANIRYYIGAPLRVAADLGIGALCVLDTCARAPASADQRAYLIGLARQASAALERHVDRRGRAA